MPLTGWLYVSTGWSTHDDRPLEVPTLYFGLFQVPHLFGLAHLADAARAGLAELFENFHSKLAWGAIGLAALHVGAALKHHLIDKDDVLTRMVPGLRSLGAASPPAAPSGRGRTLGLLAGFAAIALAALAALWLFTHPPTGASAPPAEVMHSHDEAEHEDGDDDAEAPRTARERRIQRRAKGAPAVWRVERGASSIVFTGTHAGVPFEGRFARWRADIRFDPAMLGASSASISIETASAADGVALHDQTLPGAEWFNAARHPNATFRTTSFHAHDGAYEAHGVLTIKGRAIETELPFTLRIEGDRAIMDGTTQISRRDADLGMQSDPDAEYVSADIGVRVHVEARRAP